MKFRKRGRGEKRFWTKRKIRGGVLIGIIIWVIIAYSIPLVTYGRTFWHEGAGSSQTYRFKFPDSPGVKYSANITLTTARDFSIGVDNPIHFKAVIYNVNRSDFGDLFIGLVFEYQLFETTGGFSTTPAIPQTFQSLGNGVWQVEGEMAFVNQINFTGPVLLPTALTIGNHPIYWDKVFSAVSGQVRAENFSMPQLQPQSFTDSLTKDETDYRYGGMGSAIVLAFLIPVFEGILIGEQSED